MKLSPEAEAEIERLFQHHKSEVDFPDWFAYVLSEEAAIEALRAAMVWAYQDAAAICEEIFSGAAGTYDYNSGLVDGAARIQKAIKARAANHER